MSGDYGYPPWSDVGGHDNRHHQQQQQHRPPQPPKQASWLLPDYAGSIHSRLPMPPQPPMLQHYQEPPAAAAYGGYGGGGGGYGNGGYPRKPALATEVSFDTSAKDPESVRSRIFIGCLNSGQSVVTRDDVIEVCLPYGPLKGVTHFKKQGYAFVQLTTAANADTACRELNGVRWKGCTMDVHLVGAPSTLVRGGGAQTISGAETTEKAVPTTTYDEISYDTSSRDPALLRARVFIGSLARSPIVRNDIIELCLPFGRITAVTLFKQGYAFVQFESPVDAVGACDKLHGKTWKGNKIDVHLAMEGPTRKRNAEEVESTSESAEWSGNAPKRSREEEQVKPALEMICKVCRFSCADPADFLKHREGGGCRELTRTGEPPSLCCSSCDAVFPNAWRLLFHLQDDHPHKLKLVTVDGSESGQAKARAMDDRNKAEWWATVERWLDGLQKAEEGEVEEEMEEKMEPACLVCSMCQESFVSAWKAVFHLTEHHRMKLFSPDYSKEAQTRAAEQFARERVGVEKRMKLWLDKEPHSL